MKVKETNKNHVTPGIKKPSSISKQYFFKTNNFIFINNYCYSYKIL